MGKLLQMEMGPCGGGAGEAGCRQWWSSDQLIKLSAASK